MTEALSLDPKSPRAGPGTEPLCPRFTGPPIFVSGCNRGGTTVFTRVLEAHPEVRNVGRGPFAEGQYLWRSRFRDWSRHRWAIGPWRRFLRRTAEHATPEAIAHFRRVFHDAMPAPGRMLEKTPANAIRIPFIDRVFPDCCFVHLLRDGRHTTASLLARRVFLLYAPHQWVGVHRIALADLAVLPPERVLVVRFEEFVAEPGRVLETLCRHFRLEWSPAVRERLLEQAQRHVRPPEDRWSRLPAWKKRYVLSVIGPLQQELGYPVEE